MTKADVYESEGSDATTDTRGRRWTSVGRAVSDPVNSVAARGGRETLLAQKFDSDGGESNSQGYTSDGSGRAAHRGGYCSEGTLTDKDEGCDMVRTSSAPAKISLLERRRRKFKLSLASPQPARPKASTEKHTDRYSLLETLGQGSHGVVYKAANRETGETVALKLLRVKDEELVASARREFELLSSVQHRFIIRAGEFLEHSMGVSITMECFNGRTIQAAVLAEPMGRFEESAARKVFSMLIEAIGHLHRNGIVHRDVKTANVLVSEDLNDLRLIDFSVAHRRSTDGEMLDMLGTMDFLAPEVLLGESIAEPCDIWGAGVCLYWMLFGRLPLECAKFRCQREFAGALQKMSDGAWEADDLAHTSAGQLLKACLRPQAGDRPTASELLDGAL